MASNLIVARGGIEFVPPISLAFWRWFFVFLILFFFNFSNLKKDLRTISKKREYAKLFFLGATGCGICGAFPFIAGQTTTIVNMGIIYTSSPIFIILISYLFFGEKFNYLNFIGLILCLVGVFIIIIKGNLDLLINFTFNPGDIWMLGAATGWALYSIYLYNWKTNLKVFSRFALIALFGSLSLLPFYIIEEINYASTIFNLDFFKWTLFAAISPGIIAFSLYTITQRYLGASITGFTMYLFPVYGACFGIIFFAETLEYFHYIGALLVFLGIYFVKKRIK